MAGSSPLIAGALLLTLVLGTSTPAHAVDRAHNSAIDREQADPVRGISLTDCTIGGAAARCATLAVPEDRLTGQGRTIDVFFAVLPATGGAAAPNAVFFISGGPGGVATEEFAWAATMLDDLRRDHDFVLVDQRGVGKSSPLTCTDAALEVSSLLAPNGEEALRAYADACFGHLNGNPRFYTTDMAMDDLDDVRAALGYDTIDIYAGS